MPSKPNDWRSKIGPGGEINLNDFEVGSTEMRETPGDHHYLERRTAMPGSENQFTQYCHERREALKLTTKAIAGRMGKGVIPEWVSVLLRGIRPPSQPQCEALADALEVDREFLWNLCQSATAAKDKSTIQIHIHPHPLGKAGEQS